MALSAKHSANQNQARKSERIETRVNREQKRRSEYAASLKGTTVRLAVSREHRGQGIGQLLLFDALRRALLDTSQVHRRPW
jgi:GNAT superfamily N-acetyltransferase